MYDMPPRRAWRIPIESQIHHRSVLYISLIPKTMKQTYTTNNKESLVFTSLDLANLDSLLPNFLSLLVVQEKPSLIIHQGLNRVLVDWGLTSLGGSSYDLKVVGEGVVWVSGFGEVPSDWLLISLKTWVGGLGLTLPLRVLSAEERMNRTDPLDILAVYVLV